MLNDMAFGHMDKYLRGLLGQPVFSDERIDAFSTNASQLRSIYSFLSDGWWNIEDVNGLPTRWTNGNGTVEMVSPSAQYCNLSFSAGTDVENKTLEVLLNNELIGSYQVSTTGVSRVSFSVFLKKGVNHLSFYSEQFFIPMNVNPNSTDSRRLSVYVQNVEVSRA
jgi:hypothetical protein